MAAKMKKTGTCKACEVHRVVFHREGATWRCGVCSDRTPVRVRVSARQREMAAAVAKMAERRAAWDRGEDGWAL